MPSVKARVAAQVGLHARPAALFVRAVSETGQAVTISKAGRPPVDARSLLEVMTEDFPHNCEVELRLEDSGALSAEAGVELLEGLAEVLERPEQ
ncbi:HPr family phosphocarrier protein [Pseudarthrobacter sp. J1738]|uniref:HPr family phosphocarrier protein n=1 Tax=unclassified Pseudarthrobacter TaxID=2647000 RepID=UPI003D2B3DA1